MLKALQQEGKQVNLRVTTKNAMLAELFKISPLFFTLEEAREKFGSCMGEGTKRAQDSAGFRTANETGTEQRAISKLAVYWRSERYGLRSQLGADEK